MGKVYLWAVGPQFVFIYIADAVQYMSVQYNECIHSTEDDIAALN